MHRIWKQKFPFLVLAAGIWLGVAIFGGTSLSKQDVTLRYRLPPASEPRVIDVQIRREGNVVRSSHIPLEAGQELAEQQVSLGRGAYEVEVLAGSGRAAQRVTQPFTVPGEQPTVTLRGAL